MQSAVQIWFLITCGAGAACRLCISPIRSGLITEPWAFWEKGDMTARGNHTMRCGKSSVWHPWGGLYLPRLLGRNKLLTFFLKVPNRLYCRASDAGENEMGTEECWVSPVPQVLTKPRRWCGHLDYSAPSPPRWRTKRRTSGYVITVVMWSSVASAFSYKGWTIFWPQNGGSRSLWCLLIYSPFVLCLRVVRCAGYCTLQ